MNTAAFSPGALAAAFAIGCTTTSMASAEELRITSALPPETAQTMGVQHLADRLEELSNGSLTGRVFPGTLFGLAETMGAVREGAVDVGFVVPAYHRAEFPQINLLVDLAIAGDDAVVLAGAASEYILTCDPCLREVAAQNVVMLGTGALPTYQLMSAEPIQTVEDFEGKRVRSFASFGRWVEGLGGQMVTTSATDIYEAMSQGQLDANVHPPEQLKSTSFADHMNYLLDLGLGGFIGNSYAVVNLDTWNDLSEEEKTWMMRAAADGTAYATVDYAGRNDEVKANLEELGVELITPSDELVQATEEFRDAELETIIRINRETYGIEDAAERTQRFTDLVARWEELVAGIDATDTEAVAQLYWDEAFSKVEPGDIVPQ